MFRMLGILGGRGRSFDWINLVFFFVIGEGREISSSSIVMISSSNYFEAGYFYRSSRKKRGTTSLSLSLPPSLSPAIFLRRRRKAKKLKEIPSSRLGKRQRERAFHSLIPDSYSVGLFDPRDLDLRAIEPARVEASLNFSIPLVDRERERKRERELDFVRIWNKPKKNATSDLRER